MIRSRMALSPRPCRPQRLVARVRASREPSLNRAVASLFPFHWPFDTARGGLMSRSPNRASSQKELGSKFDVYVSLSPSAMAKIREPNHLQALRSGFKALHCLGVDGVVVHVWWGLVEARAPQQYDWELYKSFFTLISDCSLQVKPFFCFHSCERVGLPDWVMELGRATPDIFFADQHSVRSHDCLSFGVDNVRVLEGRSGLQIYSDFFSSFTHHFQHLLGSQISECIVGLGPNGELRYPSYPLERWEYPGVGSFQSYDRYMISGLRAAALEVGRPEFGQEGGPHDAGSYCSWPMYTAFFRDDGGWCRDYGRFFLQWYSETLIMHGREVLHEAQRVLQNTTLQHECIRITAKLPAVHWWYNTASHAAELAAGLYNTCNRDGYVPVFRMLAEVGAGVQLGCAELANSEQAPEAMSSPENMLNHMRVAASSQGVSHIGLENCHVRFDKAALGQLESSMMGHLRYAEVAVPNAQALTINCLCDDMFAPSNWGNFKAFMSRLRTATLEAGCPPAPVGVQ